VFKLYKVEQGTFPFTDYRALMAFAKGAKSALEFGPGISTNALIEAGVPEIVTLECHSESLRKAVEALKGFPGVRVLPYENVAPVAFCEALNGHPQFDLAFVDSPRGQGDRVSLAGQEDCSRLNTCLLALRYSPIVYLHDWFRANERATLDRLSFLGHLVTLDALSCFARIDRLQSLD
jgi:hypothetical protein